MADKRRLHHLLVRLRVIKTWQLLIIFALLAGLSAYLLRQNNLGMVQRRNLVKQADEQAGDVLAALTDLQRYVTTHMNTSLGEGLFLEHSYQRAYDAKVQAAASAINPNSQAYKDIEAGCRQQYVRNGSFATFLKCIENGLKALSPGSDPLAGIKPPPQELFKHNFVSPALSLDFAGLATMATLLVGLLIILRLAVYWVLRLALKLKARH